MESQSVQWSQSAMAARMFAKGFAYQDNHSAITVGDFLLAVLAQPGSLVTKTVERFLPLTWKLTEAAKRSLDHANRAEEIPESHKLEDIFSNVEAHVAEHDGTVTTRLIMLTMLSEKIEAAVLFLSDLGIVEETFVRVLREEFAQVEEM